jgi:predicted nucleic acid-binding protein
MCGREMVKIKKLRLYLETSAISYLDQPERGDQSVDSHRLWEKLKAGEFEVFISPVAIMEIDRCCEPKLSYLRNQIRLVNFTLLEETDEVIALASRYLDARILKRKNIDDCQHIAYACVYGCDIIVSWNFRHIVNYRTISGVKNVNALAGYKEMLIYTPTFLVEGGTEEDDT